MLDGHMWLVATNGGVQVYKIPITAESSLGQCFRPCLISRQHLPHNEV